MRKVLQIAMAIMLFVCLFDMPYGYYNLVRFVAMIVFAYLAFTYFKEGREGLGISFAALALLFQPFFKIVLGRTIWNYVDIIVAIFLIFLVVKPFANKS